MPLRQAAYTAHADGKRMLVANRTCTRKASQGGKPPEEHDHGFPDSLSPSSASVGCCGTLAAGGQCVQPDGSGRRQHHRPGRDRHRSDGRSAAFGHRHHGHFRNRFDPGRAPGHRTDQRQRRHPRPADQDHSGRRRLRLADLRGKSQEAAGRRQGCCRFRLLDLGLTQGRAAVFEKENGLLYYPTFYEGLEQSKNVIYTGQEATQQILAGLDWIAKEKGAKTFYLIGSDYIWPRTSMKIARKHIENVLGGKVVGEEYYPLGNTQFGSLINKVKLKKPDVVFTAVVGGSNVAFYKQMKAAGVTSAKQNLLTLSVTEDELLGIGGENMDGFYDSMKYFQSLDNPNNKAFVEAFKAKFGKDSVIGDVTQAAYLGPWLWKAAVEKAGSFDVDKVAAASPGIELTTAPEGYVKVHENHHLWSKTRIGQVQADGQFKVVFEPDLIEPNPFPKGYQ